MTNCHTRSAMFEGTVSQADRESFRSVIEDELIPAIKTFPNVRGVRAMWSTEVEHADRNVYLMLQHDYDSSEDLAQALQSDVKKTLGPIIERINSLFEGRVYHVNFRA